MLFFVFRQTTSMIRFQHFMGPFQIVFGDVVVVIWIYNYLCNQWISPLSLWVRIPLMQDVLDTTLRDKVCKWLATGRWFSLGTPVSSTNKTDRHDMTEILLKVALNTITITRITYQILKTTVKIYKRAKANG